jgi:hypothetical protein
MTDPLSATGTVVGVVSLGITLCTGLISYIDNVKSAKEKAEQIAYELEHLSNVLELLDNVVGKAGTSSSVSETRNGIVACATALGNIRTKLEKINSKRHSGFRASIHEFKERLCYPFKQGDILHWKSALHDVQQSLHTALHALQM